MLERVKYDVERCFVRGLGSHGYNLEQEIDKIRSFPRVIKKMDRKWRGVPVTWHKNIINPVNGMLQSMQSSQEEILPGGRSQKHGHQNSALLYVLEGQGYDIHDGIKYEWSAGDLVVVTPGCVHQHLTPFPIGRPGCSSSRRSRCLSS
jgi:mannose-6-phosphate isomerase-like protein (cupin superfamily)